MPHRNQSFYLPACSLSSFDIIRLLAASAFPLFKDQLIISGAWTRWPFQMPSNPEHCMIPFFTAFQYSPKYREKYILTLSFKADPHFSFLRKEQRGFYLGKPSSYLLEDALLTVPEWDRTPCRGRIHAKDRGSWRESLTNNIDSPADTGGELAPGHSQDSTQEITEPARFESSHLLGPSSED